MPVCRVMFLEHKSNTDSIILIHGARESISCCTLQAALVADLFRKITRFLF